MNLRILIGLLFLTSQAAFAQGTVFFYNHVPEAGLDAPVFDTDGTTLLLGSQFQAQLYAGPTADDLMPVGLAASFSSHAGYWSSFGDSLDRIIPDVPPGETAFCQVRVWSFWRGSTYDQVAAADGKHGQSSVFSVTTGGVIADPSQPPTFPSYLTGLRSFSLTGTDPAPEPGTMALMITAALVGLAGNGWKGRWIGRSGPS